MKRSQLALATLSLPIDYLMLILAGLVAYQLRFESFVTDVRPILFQLTLEQYLPKLGLMAVVWLALFALAGLYNLARQLKFSQEFGRIFLGCTAGTALIIIWFFFNPSLFASRFIVLVGWVFSLIFVTMGRWLLRLVRALMYRRGLMSARVLLIGSDNNTKALFDLFQHSPQLGYQVVAVIELAGIESATQFNNIDEIIIGDSNVSHAKSLLLLNYCTTHHLGFKYAADMFEAQSHNVVVHTLAGVPLIEIKRTPLDGWGRVVKRIFDLLVAMSLLIILSPLFLLLALMIIIESGWPVIVALQRVGERAQPFKVYKFRSMIKGAQQMKPELAKFNERADGPLFKMTRDPRVTKLGRHLRRWSLDEFPQLWNVVKGEMSLVGPRPHEPEEVARYRPGDLNLLNIKPGISGLAQISGRSNLSFNEEAKLDKYYIENWSLGTDFVILIKTLVVVGQRQAAV